MKYVLSISAFLISVVISVVSGAAEWKFTPHIYSRGGLTLNENLSKAQPDNKRFNLGGWCEESNALRANLTEITLEAALDNQFKYFYGIDVQDNNRYFMGDSGRSLNERINYMEFYNVASSFWFGNRPYRGTGDYLLQNWPLDEHNMFGGGLRFEKLNGVFNIEVAYGVAANDSARDTSNNLTKLYTRNMFIHKLEYPLEKGMVKSNIEYHQISAENSEHESVAYLIGGQWQDWDRKVWSGNLYNVVVLNYSYGNVSGIMQSVFNDEDNNNLAAKMLLKWGGDWQAQNYGIFYVIQGQRHLGDDMEEWTFVDVMLRPVYGFTEQFSVGLDLAQRRVLKISGSIPVNEVETKLEDVAWVNSGEPTRIALMLAYNLKNKALGMPAVRLFVGRIHNDKETNYFLGDAATNQATFVRFDYEISF